MTEQRYAELETLLRQPPPRPVPKSFRRALLKTLILPTGIFFAIGFMFTLTGLITIGMFFPWQFPKEMKLDSGAKSNAIATVSSCESTGYEDNNAQVYKIKYEFTTPDHKAHQGYSYQGGAEVPTGSKVQVEYLNSDPDTNRILGMRLNPAGYFILYFTIFPLIGLVLLVYAVRSWSRKWRKGIGLFENGTLTQGVVKSVNKSLLNVNRQPRYKIIVSYQEFETFYYGNGDEAVRASKWQGAKTPLRVLYDPGKPEDAIVVEGILKN